MDHGMTAGHVGGETESGQERKGSYRVGYILSHYKWLLVSHK